MGPESQEDRSTGNLLQIYNSIQGIDGTSCLEQTNERLLANWEGAQARSSSSVLKVWQNKTEN